MTALLSPHWSFELILRRRHTRYTMIQAGNLNGDYEVEIEATTVVGS